jgi:hypothetical protein
LSPAFASYIIGEQDFQTMTMTALLTPCDWQTDAGMAPTKLKRATGKDPVPVAQERLA